MANIPCHSKFLVSQSACFIRMGSARRRSTPNVLCRSKFLISHARTCPLILLPFKVYGAQLIAYGYFLSSIMKSKSQMDDQTAVQRMSKKHLSNKTTFEIFVCVSICLN